MPAAKKHPSTRRRRNKASSAATLQPRALAVVRDPADYAGLTAAQLRAEIAARNEQRPADKQIPRSGAKPRLIAALQAADVAPAADIPTLPEREEGWTARTRAWWNDVWSSPMSDEWDDSDLHNLYLCALLHDDMWTATSAKARKEAAGEFRLQRASLGLDPYARRRLEWQIEVTGEAQDKGKRRRAAVPPSQPAKRSGAKPDPRAGLASVN